MDEGSELLADFFLGRLLLVNISVNFLVWKTQSNTQTECVLGVFKLSKAEFLVKVYVGCEKL